MARKNTKLAIVNRPSITILELHGLAREAARAAAKREINDLERALVIIAEAEQIARDVTASAAAELVRAETRAAAIGLNGACEHLRAAVLALEKTP